MSGEVRIPLPLVVNPVSEKLLAFCSSELCRSTSRALSKDSNIHPIWKTSTCAHCTISPEETRWIKLIINAPLTFNELVLHFQDKAVLKLPFPGRRSPPPPSLSLSPRILSGAELVMEQKTWFTGKFELGFTLLVRLFSQACRIL